MRNAPWLTGSIHQASMQAVKRGWLHVAVNCVFGEVDFRAVMLGVENATDRFVRPHLLALHA